MIRAHLTNHTFKIFHLGQIRFDLLLNSSNHYSGFWIIRENYFMNKKVRFSGWQGDKVIRLFKRDECQYENKNVHAEIISSGKIGKLKNLLIHNTFVNKASYLKKIQRHSWNYFWHIQTTIRG